MAGQLTKPSLGKLTMRLATIKDYHDVININRNIFSGMDYLPGMYRQYAHETSHFLFVAEYDATIVSYQSYKLIEDGFTAMGLSTRTSPKYQGLRIAQQLEWFAKDYIRDKIGKGVMYRVVYEYSKTRDDKVKGNPQQSILMYSHLLIYFITRKDIVRASSLLGKIGFHGDTIQSVKQLPLQYAMDLISSQENVNRLKQCDKYVLAGNYLVLELNENNLRSIVKQYRCFFTVRSSNGNGSLDICNGISSSFHCRLLDGSIRLYINYNGQVDSQVCVTHYLRQLEAFSHFMPEADDTLIKCVVSMPQEISPAVVHGLLFPLLGPRIPDETRIISAKLSDFVTSKV